ncbi:MAG TPA: hypothetical protein VGL48_10090 [Acidimicrobiales bacterium]
MLALTTTPLGSAGTPSTPAAETSDVTVAGLPSGAPRAEQRPEPGLPTRDGVPLVPVAARRHSVDFG